MNADLVDADGIAAPPRRNGELIFEAPWQSRVFGLCAAIVETCFEGDGEPFRRQLIAAIAAEPDRPYWDSWTIALQQLVLEVGLLTSCLSKGTLDCPRTATGPRRNTDQLGVQGSV